MTLDGTLLPIDRTAADRPYYPGKHKKHGMNVQVIADPHGNLLWASSALPGAVHDIKAARTHGIIDALTEAGLACWADKGYQGAQGGGLTDAERAVRERVRLDAVARLEAGDKNTVVAATLRVSERSVERWRRQWRGGGADGVASKGAPGRPRLSGTQVARLERKLERGPSHTAGLTSGGPWRASRC